MIQAYCVRMCMYINFVSVMAAANDQEVRDCCSLVLDVAERLLVEIQQAERFEEGDKNGEAFARLS